jgi:hypothetical protein
MDAIEKHIEQRQSFLRNHADTITIISVNIAIAGIYLAILLSNISGIASVNSRQDAANARMDAANARMDAFQAMMHNESKEFRELFYQETKDFHRRLCAIEEKSRNN